MKKYKMNAGEREVYDKLPDEEKKMYAAMTHDQRKKHSKMGDKEGKRYMYACTTKEEEYTGKAIKNKIFEYVDADDHSLSNTKNSEELTESHYFCKYCGTGFATEEEVDKHQRTCALTI